MVKDAHDHAFKDGACVYCKQAPTHILMHFKEHNMETLYRASDGVQIAGHQNQTVIFGENPNRRESRLFLDFESGSKWMLDWAGRQGDNKIEMIVESRNGEVTSGGLIVPATTAVDFADPSKIVAFNKSVTRQ